jgi:hypothetical protein
MTPAPPIQRGQQRKCTLIDRVTKTPIGVINVTILEVRTTSVRVKAIKPDGKPRYVWVQRQYIGDTI